MFSKLDVPENAFVPIFSIDLPNVIDSSALHLQNIAFGISVRLSSTTTSLKPDPLNALEFAPRIPNSQLSLIVTLSRFGISANPYAPIYLRFDHSSKFTENIVLRNAAQPTPSKLDGSHFSRSIPSPRLVHPSNMLVGTYLPLYMFVFESESTNSGASKFSGHVTVVSAVSLRKIQSPKLSTLRGIFASSKFIILLNAHDPIEVMPDSISTFLMESK